jgi:flavin-binding protein dodecin
MKAYAYSHGGGAFNTKVDWCSAIRCRPRQQQFSTDATNQRLGRGKRSRLQCTMYRGGSGWSHQETTIGSADLDNREIRLRIAPCGAAAQIAPYTNDRQTDATYQARRRQWLKPSTMWLKSSGTSDESISKAIGRAISQAGSTLRHLGWFEVVQIRGSIENDQVRQYQVTVRVGFTLE